MNPLNLIPPQYAMVAKITALILVMAIVFGAGWTIKGWKDEVAYQALVNEQLEAAKKRAEDALVAQQKATVERDTAQAEVTKLTKEKSDEIAKAKRENDSLRDQLITGRMRVTIPVRCAYGTTDKPTGGGELDHGTQNAELDGEVAAALGRIASDGDEAIRQLTACQGVLRTAIER